MTRTITLTGRPPVRIVEEQWPVVAYAAYENFQGEVRDQAVRTWDASIRVRQHEDGRVLIYAMDRHWSAFPHEAGYEFRGGYLLAASGDVCETVIRLAEEIVAAGGGEYMRTLGRECIADLPAEEI